MGTIDNIKARVKGAAVNGLMKFSDKLVDSAMLVSGRPEAAGAYLDSVDGRLQRNAGGGRLVISTRTLYQMSHVDPVTFAIINKFKTRITKMKWTIGPDLSDVITEIKNWERIMAAYLSPYAPAGFKPLFQPTIMPVELGNKMQSELSKLTAKTPDARKRARWLFDWAETELKAEGTSRSYDIEKFFKDCNKDSVDPFKDWLEMTIDNLCTYDAAGTVKRRTKAGNPYEFYAIDGSQVVRYRDPDYSTPQPPYRAYAWEQAGRHIADFTTDEMLYMMANPQAAGYGFSPLEAAVHTIMGSLYADVYNLDAFRSQIPPAIMNLGPVNDNQRIRFRTEWQNEVMGRGGVHRLMFINTKANKSQLQFIPMEQLTQKEMQFMEYLKWTLVIKCMCFQISPQDIGFTADLHRTTAEVQEHISTEGVNDMANFLENQINLGIIKNMFGTQNLAFKFTRDQEAMDLDKAKMHDMYLRNGVLSINDVREKLGERALAEGGDEGFIMTRTELIPVSNIFGKDGAISLDAPVDDSVAGDATPAGSVDIAPKTEAETKKAILKLRGPREAIRTQSRDAMRGAKVKRKGLIDQFAARIKESSDKKAAKARQALERVLGNGPELGDK